MQEIFEVFSSWGLPVNKLLIATNTNDILKRVVNTGVYKPLKDQHTISPSMDIQLASNFERLIFDVSSCNSNRTIKLMDDLNKKGELKLSTKELEKIRNSFNSESLTEEETKLVIKDIYNNQKILIDPHTAVGIGAMRKLSFNDNCVILSTAHPSKFSDVVKKQTGKEPKLPGNLEYVLIKEENYEKLPKDIKKIQNYILSKV